MSNVIDHPTISNIRSDRERNRENLARQLRANQMMRESARERINAATLIDEINKLGVEMIGFSSESTKMVINPVSGEREIITHEIPIPLDREVLSALRARVDIKFRLLNKVLPDLKATESISHNVHDHQHSHLHAPVSSVELTTRLMLHQQDMMKVKVVKVIEQVPIEITHAERASLEEDFPKVESVVQDTFEDEEYDWL